MRREQRPVREPRARGRNVLSFALARALDVRLRCRERALEPGERADVLRDHRFGDLQQVRRNEVGTLLEQRIERRGRVRRGAAQERVAQLVGRARRGRSRIFELSVHAAQYSPRVRART